MKRFPISLLDWVFVLRPVILVPGWVFLLLGYYAGRVRLGDPAAPWYPDARLVVSLIVGTAVMGGVYLLNQICDRETDRLNRKLYFISEARIPLAGAVAELVLLNALALVLSFAFFSPSYSVLIVVSILGGVAYSVRPARLKGRAGWDVAANGIGFGGVAFAIGWASVAPLHPVVFLHAIPYAFAVGAIHTNAAVLDIEGDRMVGDRTIAVHLGPGRSRQLGTVLAGGTLVSAFALGEIPAAIWAVVSVLAFAWTAWIERKGVSEKSTAANQMSGRAFVILEGLRFPYFLMWLIVVYLATKWYYQSRFGIDYPSLKDTRDEKEPPAEPVRSS